MVVISKGHVYRTIDMLNIARCYLRLIGRCNLYVDFVWQMLDFAQCDLYLGVAYSLEITIIDQNVK